MGPGSRRVVSSFENYMKLLYEHAYFDFPRWSTSRCNSWRVTPTTRARALSSSNQRDIRSSWSTSTRVNPLQERVVAASPVRRGLSVVGDDDQRSTSGVERSLQMSPLRTATTRSAGNPCRELPSSEGVVEVGRSVAERIPDANRLPKAMVRAVTKWQRGDMIARDFADEREEAAGSMTIERYAGWFRDTAEGHPRGLSWSDFAVLYRSVANDAGPLVGRSVQGHPVCRQGPEPLVRQPRSRQSLRSSGTWPDLSGNSRTRHLAASYGPPPRPCYMG